MTTCPLEYTAAECPSPPWYEFWKWWLTHSGSLTFLQDETAIKQWFEDNGYSYPQGCECATCPNKHMAQAKLQPKQEACHV